MNRFRLIWQRDYLLTLGAQKFKSALKPDLLELGQVVLVQEDDVKGKAKWTLARVVALTPGRDGATRRVRLLGPKGEYSRHISKIALLESHDEADGKNLGSGGETPLSPRT